MDEATSDRTTVTLPGKLPARVDARVGGNYVDGGEFVRAAARHYVEPLQSAGAQTRYIG